MMTLKETVEKYGMFLNDYELIKAFFSENNLEEMAIEMLTEISKETIARNYNYIARLKQDFSYSQVMEYNPKLTKKQKEDIIYFYNCFLTNGKLNESDLKKAKECFDGIKKDNLIACPNMFLGYLQSENIATQFVDCKECRDILIESGGKKYL